MIWTLVMLLLLVSFTFSGIEAGILSVNRVRLQHRLKAGDKAAIKLSLLLEHPQRLLGTVLLVTNFMNICALILATHELVRHLGVFGYFLSFLLFLPIFVLGIELLPKSMFRRFPYRALAFFAELLRLTDLILSPLLGLGGLLARFLVHRNETEHERKKLFVAREDFKYLTIESEKVGALGRLEREMIHNVVDFRGIKASDVMIPMEKVPSVLPWTKLDEAARVGSDLLTVRSRQGDGEIVGVLSVYEALLDRGLRGEVSSCMRRVVCVPEAEPAYSVIRKLREARLGMAVVAGSNGEPCGLVRSEDLVRRLVSTAKA